MKKTMNYKTIFALVFLGAFVTTSCDLLFSDDKDDRGYLPAPSTMAMPQGGLVTAMNGNVTLDFPTGAVNEPVKIVVTNFVNVNSCNFLLKMIRIEPALVFGFPVTVKLKYDGDLRNSETSPEGNNIVVCYWESETDYNNRVKAQCLSCYVDAPNKTIDFYIEQTGIFTVGVMNNILFN